MIHRWTQIATRNWRASRARTVAIVVSVALGVGTVVVISSFHETARSMLGTEVVNRWLGTAHVTIAPQGAHWGSLDASLADELHSLPGVEHVTARLVRRLVLFVPTGSDQVFGDTGHYVDAFGINPETEYDFRSFTNLEGRTIQAGERRVAVIEREMAMQWGVGLGDRVSMFTHRSAYAVPMTIVGLYDSQRLADFQEPMVFVAREDVEDIKGEKGVVTEIDLKLHDPTPESISATQLAVEALLREKGAMAKVNSARARQELLNEADRISRLVLSLVAFISLITSFFIIVTTMSMSLFERRTALGILRCVGMTRGQLTLSLLIELGPLGIAGIVVGSLAGCGLVLALPRLVPEPMPPLIVSGWGVRVGAISGLLTTLISWGLLVYQVNRVTPLAAVYTQAKPARKWVAVVSGVLGLALIFVHETMARDGDATKWLQPGFAGVGSVSHYLGYVLLAPLIVILFAPPIIRVIAPLLRLPGKLAADQVLRSPWRSTGVCWMLMVGLSLIVYIAMRAESILAIWDFPAKLPDAFVWTPQYVTGVQIDRVRALPGVGYCTATADVDCELVAPGSSGQAPPKSFLEGLIGKLSRPVFVAGEAETLLGILKLTFVEGTLEDVKAKIERGGYVVIPTQTSKNKNLHLGDRVGVRIRNRTVDFEIAGVVQSPALDIAVTAFQATSYFDYAAASALLGTRDDLKDKFGLDIASMLMFDFELPPTAPPREFWGSRLIEEKENREKNKGILAWKLGDAMPPDAFTAGEPPDHTNDRSLADYLLNWKSLLPEHADLIEPHESALRVWLDDAGSNRVPADVRPLLVWFGKGVRHISYHWDRHPPQYNWSELRERLVLLRVADEMDRPDAILGSLTRMREIGTTHLRRTTRVVTWLPSIVLVVAAIGVANLMMISVQMRSRQLAVLRAVGALKSQIVRLVLAEAIALAILGCMLGMTLGLHQAHSVNRIVEGLLQVRLEFIVPVGTLLIGVLVTVTVCLAAAIAPARYAARNNIVEAMQVA